MPDAPFLVDTVRAAVQGAGHRVRLLLHPIVGIERDADGRIARVTDARESGGRESVMRVELERQLTPDEGEALVTAVRDALADLQLAVGDFAAMLADGRAHGRSRARCRAAVRGADEVEETAAFLEWLRDGHFILLGARDYDMTEGPTGASRAACRSARGSASCATTARRASPQPTPLDELPEFLRERLIASGDLLVIGKTNRHLARAPARAHGRRLGARCCGPTARSPACCA